MLSSIVHTQATERQIYSCLTGMFSLSMVAKCLVCRLYHSIYTLQRETFYFLLWESEKKEEKKRIKAAEFS